MRWRLTCLNIYGARNPQLSKVDAALLVLHHVDSLMSNWNDTSEVARINREADLADVIEVSFF